MVALKKMDIIIIILGLFCIIYNPPLIIIGSFHINSLHVVGAFSICYLFFKRKEFFLILKEKSILFLISICCISAVYLLVPIIGGKQSSFSIIYRYVYFLVDIIPFGLALKIYQRERHYSVEDFLELIVLIATIQAGIAIAALLFKDFHQSLVDRFLIYGYGEVYEAISSWRLYGFAGGLTFASAIFQSIVAIISLELTNKKGNQYFINAVVIALSAIINARTSIVVLGVGFILILCFGSMTKNKKIIMLLSMCLGFLLGISILGDKFEKTFEWVSTGWKEIVNFLKGDFDEGYFSYIMNKKNYPLPKTTWGILFGEGHGIMGGKDLYGVASDIGYINDLWMGGIYFVCLLTILWGNILGRLLQKRELKILRFIGLFLICVLPIVNFKGPIFGMNDVSNFIIILFLLLPAKIQKKRELNASIGDRL